jgi:hypothetical protein
MRTTRFKFGDDEARRYETVFYTKCKNCLSHSAKTADFCYACHKELKGFGIMDVTCDTKLKRVHSVCVMLMP